MDEQKKDELHARLLAEKLPVDSLNAALLHLRRPFAADAVKWKVQSTWDSPRGKGAVLVAYVDARVVIERLNAVVGGAWNQDYRPLSKDTMLACDLTVFGVKRPDVGESPKKLSKDLVSDALKRAAVQFGVGVSVYALPQASWALDKAGAALKEVGKDKKSIVLTDEGHASLRQSYRDWLTRTGEKSFGPVLDHGDILWIDGMPGAPVEEEPEDDAETPTETPTVAPEPVSDTAGVQLRAEVEGAYLALREESKAALLPAAFQAELTAAQGSHEGLRELLTRLQDLTADARAKTAA